MQGQNLTKEMAVQVIQTDEIGDHLHKEYGSEPTGNTHIGCFYIKLGQEIIKSPRSQQEAIATLNRILPDHWVKTEPGWDGVIFFQAPGGTAANNEREIEANINSTIRLPLITDLSGQSSSHIMFSRACLYKENDKKCVSSQEITTDTIEKIIGSTHIEYFYLFVQAVVREESSDTKQLKINDEKVHSKALEELNKLPGNWKSVKPQETWSGTFFGFFSKGNATNDRTREREDTERGGTNTSY